MQRATQLYCDMYPSLSMHGMIITNRSDQGFLFYSRDYPSLNAFNAKSWMPNDVVLVK